MWSVRGPQKAAIIFTAAVSCADEHNFTKLKILIDFTMNLP